MKRLPDIAIFDLDGCLFDDEHRLPLIDMSLEGDARYEAYHAEQHVDLVIENGYALVKRAVEQNLLVVFLTARPIKHSVATLDKLSSHFNKLPLVRFPIYMRPDGDARSSVEFKREKVREIIAKAKDEGREVIVALDDRQDVVDMYREEGVPAWVLDKNGSACPGVLRDSRWCLEQRGLLRPVEDGPTQPQPSTPPDRERDAGDVLREALATYYDRRGVYGVAHVKFGDVMAALFPDGITLKTSEDHQLFHMFGHMAGKLTRFAGSGLKDHDSVLDIATYAALAHCLVDGADIDTGRKHE